MAFQSSIPLHHLLQKTLDFIDQRLPVTAKFQPIPESYITNKNDSLLSYLVSVGTAALHQPLPSVPLLESVIRVMFHLTELHPDGLGILDKHAKCKEFLALIYEDIINGSIIPSREGLTNIWQVFPVSLETFTLSLVESCNYKSTEMEQVLETSLLVEGCIREPKLFMKTMKIMLAFLQESTGHSQLLKIIQIFVEHVKKNSKTPLFVSLYPAELQPLAFMVDSYSVVSDVLKAKENMLLQLITALRDLEKTKVVSISEIKMLMLLNPGFYKDVVTLGVTNQAGNLRENEAGSLLSLLWDGNQLKTMSKT